MTAGTHSGSPDTRSPRSAPWGMTDTAQKPSNVTHLDSSTLHPQPSARHSVALLTGGADKPYALGLAEALIDRGVPFDFIGSDEVNGPQLHDTHLVNFLNLRGDQREDASRWSKGWRILVYYARLIRYAVTAKPKLFHILWNNKWLVFDRTALMLYYRLLGKRVVLTAHNVNAGKRDDNDTALNRLSLKIQYRLCHHIFVHTERMKAEMLRDFGVKAHRVSVIPFGINNTLPNTELTRAEARQTLGLAPHQKSLLFFGHIAPYKGLEYLVQAWSEVRRREADCRLIVAGPVKNCPAYWRQIQESIQRAAPDGQVIQRVEFIPDDEVEVFFKAADVLVLPYLEVFQSGVLFLAYSFGVPVIATDVGSLREDILEERTGFVCKVRDPDDLARTIEKFLRSDLYRELDRRRSEIQAYANEKYSWSKVGDITARVYSDLLKS